jgi:NAD(P)-dependent dehydrogenase (short-subunit alcohol dehydrogenase family)
MRVSPFGTPATRCFVRPAVRRTRFSLTSQSEAVMADAHSKPVWLITGCSTGFGRELAKILLDRGYRVVATARDHTKIADLVAGHEKTGLALKLDVDNQADIGAAVKAAEARFGRIDVLVNNAGYGYLAAIEEGDDSDVRAMFDTNFFGLAAMTRAVLPIMRAQKSGAIINISSIGGFIGFPGSGYYAATKFAVEGLSEALSKEVGPLGIKVIIVEPGPFRTDWAGRSLKTPKKPIDAYAETAIGRRRQIQSYSGNQPGDPVRASEAIITAVGQEHPPLRLPLGAFAYESMGMEIAALRKEHDSLEAVARGADYPKAS